MNDKIKNGKEKFKKKTKKYFLLILILVLILGAIGFTILQKPIQRFEETFNSIDFPFLNTQSQARINPINTAYNGNYKVKTKTGNESLYDVTFSKDSKTNITTICLEAGWDNKEVLTYSDLNEKIIDKNYTYSVPVSLSFYKTSELSKQSDLIKVKDNEISLTSLENPNKFCYEANPKTDFYLKFGDNSIIVIQEEDFIGEGLLVNVTAETGEMDFAHLNASNEYPFNHLLGYWNFDGDLWDTIGYNVYDFSNFDNDGLAEVQGTLVVNNTDCLYGSCSHGSADTYDRIRIDDSNSFQFMPLFYNFTISAWAKCNFDGVTNNVIWSFQGADDIAMFGCYVDGTPDQSIMFWRDVGGSATFNYPNDGSSQGWHHYVFTSNASDNHHVFIDGIHVLTFTDTGTAGPFESVDPFYINSFGVSQEFNGNIDEVMIFNVSLSSTQILDIYNNQSNRFMENGLLQLNNQSVLNISSGNNKVNVSTIIENNFGSQVNLSVGHYTNPTWSYTLPQTISNHTNFTFTIDDTATNLTLNYTLIAGDSSYSFYSPIMKGTIILDYFSSGEPPEDTCTAPGSGNWNVDCSDNCFWDTDQTVPGNISITGAGFITFQANFTFTKRPYFVYVGETCTLYNSGGNFL